MDYAVLFIFGLILGSFYNVLIYRLPRNLSLITPASHCPECKKPIRWYDNVPLLSYMILRGRCRNCGAEIPLQYPLVELSSGLLSVLAYYMWGASYEALFMYIFFSALLVLSLIDIKFFILPDIITVPGIGVGLISSLFRTEITPAQSIVGAVFGFVVPFSIYLYYVKFRKMEGLGFGDVKLLSMIGAFTGIYGVFSALFIGSLLGLVFTLPSLIKNRNFQFVIPFGPFLSAGCFIGVLFKEKILSFLFPT